MCANTRASELHLFGIDLVFLLVSSPGINPPEQVWKSLRLEASPLIV